MSAENIAALQLVIVHQATADGLASEKLKLSRDHVAVVPIA
jgi:hypothetical protein